MSKTYPTELLNIKSMRSGEKYIPGSDISRRKLLKISVLGVTAATALKETGCNSTEYKKQLSSEEIQKRHSHACDLATYIKNEYPVYKKNYDITYTVPSVNIEGVKIEVITVDANFIDEPKISESKAFLYEDYYDGDAPYYVLWPDLEHDIRTFLTGAYANASSR